MADATDIKLERVAAMRERRELDELRLLRPPNYAWLTGGELSYRCDQQCRRRSASVTATRAFGRKCGDASDAFDTIVEAYDAVGYEVHVPFHDPRSLD